MIPLILFSDDTSGNRSKKWNRFDNWALLLAGLSKSDNAKLENIHLMTASNRVSAMDMCVPIAKDLLKLEGEGMVVYDSYMKQKVMVIAPVICCICDNARASDIVNHIGSAANKYCRICQVICSASS